LIAGFARSCYRHWIPWRVHLGGAGEVRCSDLARGVGRERSAGGVDERAREPAGRAGPGARAEARSAFVAPRDEGRAGRGTGPGPSEEREMSELTVGVVRQDDVGERRVALVPESVARLAALGLGTVVQEGAGAAAWFPDAEYAAAGATVVPGPAVYERA